MDFEIRAIREDEIELFRTKLSRGFGGDLSEKDEDRTVRFRAIVPLERTRAAFEGPEMIGTLACLPYQLSVPGGHLPMGGTTMVTVQQTHRRRGVLRAMMLDHLDDVRAAAEPVAGLWASESSIYGRFGFGPATERYEIELEAREIRFTDDRGGGDVRLVETDAAAEALPPIYDGVHRSLPGTLRRGPDHWRWSALYDPERWRHGMSMRRYVVHRGPDGDDGYAMYRQKEKWEGFLSRGKVTVSEVIAATPEAHAALWRYLTSIDLFPRVTYWNLPVDDQLPWRVSDPRRVLRKVWDGLWLRILDVPAALAGRSYLGDGRLRVEVRDDLYPNNNGTFEITSRSGESACERVSGEPDLSMDVATLGAIYLGGRRLGPPARAGRVHGSPEAVAKADLLFSWDPAPWCQEIF